MMGFFEYSKHEWLPQKCTIAVYDGMVSCSVKINWYINVNCLLLSTRNKGATAPIYEGKQHIFTKIW